MELRKRKRRGVMYYVGLPFGIEIVLGEAGLDVTRLFLARLFTLLRHYDLRREREIA